MSAAGDNDPVPDDPTTGDGPEPEGVGPEPGPSQASQAVPTKQPEKKARTFDFMQMVELSTQTAKERNREVLEKREEEEAQAKLLGNMAISSQGSKDSGLDESDSEDIGPELPPAFGQAQPKPASVPKPGSDDLDKSQHGTSISPDFDEDGVIQEQEVSVEQLIPASLEAKLTHGNKPVSALCIDTQGARFATGGYDYIVKLWDFGGMDAGFRSFRELQPVEANLVRVLAYSCNGEHMIVGSGLPVVKILDRQGSQWGETTRGDMYLVDQINTKGHVAGINSGCWHPTNKEEFLTAADDCTIRIWNTADWKQVTKCIPKHRSVIRVKNKQGKKAIPTSVVYSRDAKFIAAGCNDGSIQLWKHAKIFVSPTMKKWDAHGSGDITCICFSYDNMHILSRGFDDTLKLWNLKNFTKPVHTATGLENMFPCTPCAFSPRDELCVTGTSVRKGRGDGRLVFFDKTTFNPVYQIKYPDESVTQFLWHPKLNQMMVALSNGQVKLYYDLKSSARGALLCLKKPVKRERQKEVLLEEIILAPLTLDMFQPRGEEGQEKEVTSWRLKKFLRNQSKDPTRKFKNAQPPHNGPTDSGSTLHSFFLQNLGRSRNQDFLEDKDVRASILRHAEEAEKDPIYVGKVYRKTQPVPIFQEETEAPPAEDDDLQPVFKKQKLA